MLSQLKLSATLLAEAGYIFVKLQTGVKDRALRKTYRSAMARIIRRRPTPEAIQAYAIKCAMHYHSHRLVGEMGEGKLVNSF